MFSSTRSSWFPTVHWKFALLMEKNALNISIFYFYVSRWYTSMVGRKSNLKFLTSKLWEVGVKIVKTTEFVQGRTCRWGLAWSFVSPTVKKISPSVNEKSNLSFMLQVWISFTSLLHLFWFYFYATLHVPAIVSWIGLLWRFFHANPVQFMFCNQLNPFSARVAYPAN